MIFKNKRRYSFESSRRRKKVEDFIKFLRKVRWRYRNSIAFLLTLLSIYFIARTEFFRNFISGLGEFGYLGSFIAGLFYTFSFTIAASLILLYFLGKSLNLFLLALFASFGALLGDFVIFKFVRDNLSNEIKLLLEDVKNSIHFNNSFFFKTFPFSNMILSRTFQNFVEKIYSSKFFKFFFKIVGYIIIASPIPDEIGITFIGLTKTRKREFIPLVFILNFMGILSFLILTQKI